MTTPLCITSPTQTSPQHHVDRTLKTNSTAHQGPRQRLQGCTPVQGFQGCPMTLFTAGFLLQGCTTHRHHQWCPHDCSLTTEISHNQTHQKNSPPQNRVVPNALLTLASAGIPNLNFLHQPRPRHQMHQPTIHGVEPKCEPSRRKPYWHASLPTVT